MECCKALLLFQILETQKVKGQLWEVKFTKTNSKLSKSFLWSTQKNKHKTQEYLRIKKYTEMHVESVF